MLLGFIYQIGQTPDYSFKEVKMLSTMTNYMKQVKEVHDNKNKILCQWKVFKKYRA